MAGRDFLKEIVQKQKERVLIAKQQLPEADLKAKLAYLAPAKPFLESINKPRQISLIAEIKKSSPSKGVIRENFNLQEIAAIYKESGAQAISVLTEGDYFAGDLSFLNEVKNISGLPVLRKDFIIEPYQVYESFVFGADAILLIASILTKERLVELLEIAESLGLDCIVEVHTEKELKKILKIKSINIIGINNRSLHNLEVDLQTTQRLFPLIPKEKSVVVESGISSHKEVAFLKILGINAVLIGEAFMAAQDIKAKIEEIMGW